MGRISELTVEWDRFGETSVVRARGEIDLQSSPDVEYALERARASSEVVILDLRDVEFIDTSGLRMIVLERQRAAAAGYRFLVVRGPRDVQRIFEIAGLPAGDPMFIDAPPALPGSHEA